MSGVVLRLLLLAVVCLIPLSAYTEENGVLVLTEDDLSNITQIFPHLFVKYYVSWYTWDHAGASIARNWRPSSTKWLRSFRR
jgi:hypothetical protein